jgi:hypothetical protein
MDSTNLNIGIYRVIENIIIPINEKDVATTMLGDFVIIYNNKVYVKHYNNALEPIYIETYLSPAFVVVNPKIFQEQ